MRWIRSHRGHVRLVAARLGVAGLTATGALFIAAVPAHALIGGPCSGFAFSTPRVTQPGQSKPTVASMAVASKKAGGSIVDLKETDWHVPSWKDDLAGAGRADGAMESGFAQVSFFGFKVDVARGSGSDSRGQGGPISAYDIVKDHLPPPFDSEPPAAILSGYGEATLDAKAAKPATGNCTGSITVHFDDASAPGTAAGQVGIGLMVVGAAGVAGAALRRV